MKKIIIALFNVVVEENLKQKKCIFAMFVKKLNANIVQGLKGKIFNVRQDATINILQGQKLKMLNFVAIIVWNVLHAFHL